MEENKAIKKAIGELEQVSGDEKIRRIAELKEKYIRDEQASLEYAKDEGYKTGKEEGRNERNLEVAKNLLKQNITIDIISKATGLTQEEIEKLKKN